MARFFFTNNAAYPISVAGRALRFEVTGRIAGMVQGVVKLEDDATASALLTKPGVSEINEADYEEALKKKGTSLPYQPSSKDTPPPSETDTSASAAPVPAREPTVDPQPTVVAMKGAGGVVLEGGTAPVESVAEEDLPPLDESIDSGVLEMDAETKTIEAKPKRTRAGRPASIGE